MPAYKIAVLSVLTLIRVSCDSLNAPIVDHQARVSAAFRLADTTGIPSAIFHTGRSMDMSCVLSNPSNVDVVYHEPSPAVVFRIASGDSTIASSTDGLAFPQVIVTGTLTSGKSFSFTWRGPNTAGRNPQISLPPGNYTARATLKIAFDNAIVTPPVDIGFTVIP
jgi:hypothetical protein